jgi:hypothetical protein
MLGMLSNLQRRGTLSVSLEAADPEGEDHPDLLKEEAAGDSSRWSW